MQVETRLRSALGNEKLEAFMLMGYENQFLWMMLSNVFVTGVALPRGGLEWTCPPQFAKRSIFQFSKIYLAQFGKGGKIF